MISKHTRESRRACIEHNLKGRFIQPEKLAFASILLFLAWSVPEELERRKSVSGQCLDALLLQEVEVRTELEKKREKGRRNPSYLLSGVFNVKNSNRQYSCSISEEKNKKLIVKVNFAGHHR